MERESALLRCSWQTNRAAIQFIQTRFVHFAAGFFSDLISFMELECYRFNYMLIFVSQGKRVHIEGSISKMDPE